MVVDLLGDFNAELNVNFARMKKCFGGRQCILSCNFDRLVLVL